MAFLVGDSAVNAYEHMKKVRQAVEDLHIPHNPSASEWVTISMGGVTAIPDRAEGTYDTYLKLADTMLYDAKRFGRNMVVWADEGMKRWREK